MSSARPRIAYQGVPGAFSEEAIRAFWGDETINVPCRTFADVISAVRSGTAAGAVLPVENLVVGPITSALDAIDDFSEGLIIGGQTDVPVVHALLGIPGSTLEQITRITSHPVALSQCHRFLLAFGVPLEPYFDTAGAAQLVSETKDPTLAAVAGHAAAELYGLIVLSEAIQDEPENWTRFVRIEAGT
jgi:prephenate dehydratase